MPQAYFIPFYKWEIHLPKVPDLVRASQAASRPPQAHPHWVEQAAGQTSGLGLRTLPFGVSPSPGPRDPKGVVTTQGLGCTGVYASLSLLLRPVLRGRTAGWQSYFCFDGQGTQVQS